MQLIYHKTENVESPFDRHALEISRDSELFIACPYINLDYFQRLIRVCSSWRLLTDVEELLASIVTERRFAVVEFIIENESSIRHLSGLHAKVLIGSRNAMLGSANLTTSGIQIRTEMAAFITESEHLAELRNWFDENWRTGIRPQPTDLWQLRNELPDTQKCPVKLAQNQRSQSALVPLVEYLDLDILEFEGARGYSTGNGKEFCVIKGSECRRKAPALQKHQPNYYRQRQQLIDSGVLTAKCLPTVYRHPASFK